MLLESLRVIVVIRLKLRKMKDAIKKRIEAKISEADTTIKLILNSSVAVGTHVSTLLDDLEKALKQKAEYEDMANVLEDFKKKLVNENPKC